ncbi:MAG: hypothetical protein ACR2O0_00620 [Rhizobiaceae bacterium]
MKKLTIGVLLAISLAGCTTIEKTATGAGVGAAIGAATTKTVGGAVVGAFVGGIGTFLATTADGFCQYRRFDGTIITRRCHFR